MDIVAGDRASDMLPLIPRRDLHQAYPARRLEHPEHLERVDRGQRPGAGHGARVRYLEAVRDAFGVAPQT